jgi:carbon monoxide dehydrogenase subunit G
VKINNEFTVSAPVEKAWEVILDLERVAPCLPGAAIQEEKGDGEYDGTMKVKIGPITANYKGTVKFEEVDEANRRVVLEATGRDARGQGTASATIVSTMQDQGDKTKVNVETDMKLTGRAAQFGRGIAQDVATKMLGRFAACLEEEISGGGGAEAGAQQDAASSASTDGGGADGSSAGASTTAPVVGSTGGAAGRVISGAGAGSLGGGTAGAVVSGGPGAAEPAATTTGGDGGQQAEQQRPRREPRPEPEAFDLGAVGQDVVLDRLKKAAPAIAGGTVALLVMVWLLRRKR